MFKSVRIRLTLWYVGVLAVALVTLSVVVYISMATALRARLDATLRDVNAVTAMSLQHELEDHPSREEAERRFAAGLRTLLHKTFPKQAIAVYAGSRLVATKPGEQVRAPHRHEQVPQATHSDGERREAVLVLRAGGLEYQIVSAEGMRTANVELEWLRQALFAGVPATLLLIAIGGWFFARRALQPLIAMSRELESSIQHQKRFMADASHELRTPISVARTAAEVTLELPSRPEEEYRDSLTMIEQQLRRLTRIVQDMFTLAQADAGVYRVQRSPFYLDELLRDCVRAAGVLGSRRGVTVRVDAVKEAPCHGDEGLVRQLVMILLDNGIKYTPEGGEVRVSLERGEHDWKIRVADTGIGIPADAQAFVFRRFYRVDKSRSRASSAAEGGSGAGLGLAIAHWIAQVHHGRLELTASRPGSTVFTAVLPVGEA